MISLKNGFMLSIFTDAGPTSVVWGRNRASVWDSAVSDMALSSMSSFTLWDSGTSRAGLTGINM